MSALCRMSQGTQQGAYPLVLARSRETSTRSGQGVSNSRELEHARRLPAAVINTIIHTTSLQKQNTVTVHSCSFISGRVVWRAGSTESVVALLH